MVERKINIDKIISFQNREFFIHSINFHWEKVQEQKNL